MPRTRVQQYARSVVHVLPRAAAPLWRVGCAKCCGQKQLLRQYKFPTGAMPLLCATAVCKWSMLCYGGTAVLCYGGTAVDSSINSIGICAWHLCFE